MDLTTLLYASLFIISLYWLYKSTSKPRNFPPGPPRLPLVGSAPYLTAKNPRFKGDSIVRNQDLAAEYGKVCGFHIASQPVVMFTDYEIMRDVFKRDCTTFRPSNRYYTHGNIFFVE